MNELFNNEKASIRASHTCFFGSFAQQNPAAFLSFNRLLNSENFDLIIELGTHDAGLSTMFALYSFLSCNPAQSDDPNEPVLYKNHTHHRRCKNFITFDYKVRDKTAIAVLKHLGGQFIQADTLNDQSRIAEIQSLIAAKELGRVLLLCDGGNKKKEFELYGSALKKGDFIMLHDWAKDEQAFESNKQNDIWHGWETRWENGQGDTEQFGIKELCEKHNVEPIYAEEFDKVAWFCGRKN